MDAASIADSIEVSGRTWKLYAESIPSPGYAVDEGEYATRHVPFLYYKDILENDARRTGLVVPFTDLAIDLRSASTTPNYGFVTPDLGSDMHDCFIAAGDAWLSPVVLLILRPPAFTGTRSLLLITWDEGDEEVGDDNHVATILAGTGVKQGYRSSRPYDYHSLLHTIDADWGMPPLTANDAIATTMGEFLRKRGPHEPEDARATAARGAAQAYRRLE